MKRDLDLSRIILFAIEKDEKATGHGFISLNIDGYSEEQISYHVQLLQEAGLIEAKNWSSQSSFQWVPSRLTWQGHEFLDSARSDNLWSKAKEEMKNIGSFSFQLLLDILLDLAVQQ